MKSRIMSMFCAAVTMAAAIMTVAPSNAQEAAAGVPVRMTVTATGPNDKRMPELSQRDIAVTQGKERLKVTEWVPAKGDRAGLDLFILIDDASNPTLGMHFDDLKTFINAQPSTTAIGVGYMRNATVQIVQNFTTDHAAAAKALRLPLASVGAYGSPYLSVIDLMKRWPASQNRREVLMVTDGIDRARRCIPWRGLYINPDVDSASDVAMRTGTIIHTIYAPGVGPPSGRNYWKATNGQIGHCEAVRCNRWRVLFSGTAATGEFRAVSRPTAEHPQQPVSVELFRAAREKGAAPECVDQHRSCRGGTRLCRWSLGAGCEVTKGTSR